MESDATMEAKRKKKEHVVMIYIYSTPAAGEYHNLLQERRTADPQSHFRYLRVLKERFDCLLAEVFSAM